MMPGIVAAVFSSLARKIHSIKPLPFKDGRF